MVEITAKISSRFRYATILLRQLVKSDFKLRYQNSVLGYVWSLLKPLFLFAIMYTVFVGVLHVDYGVPHSGVYLLLGIVLWSFFSEITSGSVSSIVGKGDILRKLNFPRYVIVLSCAFSALINMLLNMLIVLLFIIFSQVHVGWSVLLAPVVFAELFLLGLALAFFLSATFVKLRDIGHVWDVAMQALFYATPLFYPLALAPHWAQKIIMLSPLSQTIQDLRYILISTKTPTIDTVYGNHWVRLVPIAICFVVFTVAALYFKQQSKYFAEEI